MIRHQVDKIEMQFGFIPEGVTEDEILVFRVIGESL